jgi:hypothetical protein
MPVYNTPWPGSLWKNSAALGKPQTGVRDDQSNSLQPHLLRCLRNALQPALPSLPPLQMPRISRKPWVLTPMATSKETLRTSPAQLRLSTMLSKTRTGAQPRSGGSATPRSRRRSSCSVRHRRRRHPHPHKASVMSSTRRTEILTRYICV